MSRRVVITGVEIIAGNTNNYTELCSNMKNPVTAISDDEKYVGTEYCSYKTSRMKKRYDNNVLVSGVEKIELMIEDTIQNLFKGNHISQKYLDSINSESVICFGTSLAGNEKVLSRLTEQSKNNSLYTFPKFITKIKKKSGMECFAHTVTTACSSGTVAMGIAFDEIKSGKKKFALVGAADPLSHFSHCGFHSLKAMDSEVCAPFSTERRGLNLGEGVAFFIVEELENAIDRGAEILAEILGYGLGNDAYHMTKPDVTGDGVYSVMKKALGNNVDLDYINAHGTGTVINDEVELRGIKKLIRTENYTNILVSSTKNLFGHCLGATGAIELAVCLAIFKNERIPIFKQNNIQLEDQNTFLTLQQECSDLVYPINNILSNSLAFGGNSASIYLRRWQS